MSELTSEVPSQIAAMSIVGGAVPLDFTNTVHERTEDGYQNDQLTGYADLLWWSYRVDLLSVQEVHALLAAAKRRPRAASRVYARAIRLREALYRIYSSSISSKTAGADDLALLNRELAIALKRLSVAPSQAGFAQDFSEDAEALDRVLWPIAKSAADLLTSESAARIGQCPGTSCRWLFLDTSRNRMRRWCDMKECGNREKARRHYARRRALGS